MKSGTKDEEGEEEDDEQGEEEDQQTKQIFVEISREKDERIVFRS